jgi:ankyrin repeat protein
MSADCNSIFRATIFSSTKLLQLLKQRCDPNIESSDGLTPIYWAAFARKPDSAALLISFGANVNKKLMHSSFNLPIGITPIHAAAFSGALDVLRILKDNNGELNTSDSVGQTPLHYCARGCRVVGALLDAGADPLLKDLGGRSPLLDSLSASRDYFDGRDYYANDNLNDGVASDGVLKIDKLTVLLLSKMGNIKDVVFPMGETVLHLAIQNCHKAVNEYILENFDVNLNARNDEGLTPLHLAAYSYTREGWPAELLLNKGANPFISSNEGLFPLDIAINNNNDAAIKILRKLGAPENEKTRESLVRIKAKVVQQVIDDINDDRDKVFHTTYDVPLSRSWFDELYDVTRFFIFHGLDVNAKDSMGHSPLHRAILEELGYVEGNQQISNLEFYLGQHILWPDQDDVRYPDIWENYVKSI